MVCDVDKSPLGTFYRERCLLKCDDLAVVVVAGMNEMDDFMVKWVIMVWNFEVKC